MSGVSHEAGIWGQSVLGGKVGELGRSSVI